MGRYAMVVTASGLVDNVIVYDGVSPFTPPTGIELIEATNDAEPGGTWNGSAFVRAPVVPPTRTQVLMYEVTNTKQADGETDKTAETIAAEKLELKNLLTASLVGGADLGQVETQTLLRLERE